MSKLVEKMKEMRKAVDRLKMLTTESRVTPTPKLVVRADPAIEIELDVNPLKALLRRQRKYEAITFFNNIKRVSSAFRHEVLVLLDLCEEIARGSSDPVLLFETSDLLLAKCEKWDKRVPRMGIKEQKVLLEICLAIGKYHESFAQAIFAVDVDCAYESFVPTAIQASDHL